MARAGWGSTEFLVAQLNATPDLGAFSEELSSWTVRLAASTEHNLAGTSRPDLLVGTASDDTLRANDGKDIVLGGKGNDILYAGADDDVVSGGEGNDTLYGDTGNDTYLFGRGSGTDIINEYDATAGNTDTLSIGAGVAANQMWFRRVGSDLEVSIIGSTDKSTISSWYSGGAYHVEQFKTSDGKLLLDSQVDALVSAMAAFAPPAAGQTTLLAGYQTVLNPVIAANWK